MSIVKLNTLDELSGKNTDCQVLITDTDNQAEGSFSGRRCRPMDNATIRATLGVCLAVIFTAAVIGVSDFGCSFVEDETDSEYNSNSNRVLCYTMVSMVGSVYSLFISSVVFGSFCVFATPTNLKKIPGFMKDVGTAVADDCCPLNGVEALNDEDVCHIDYESECSV